MDTTTKDASAESAAPPISERTLSEFLDCAIGQSRIDLDSKLTIGIEHEVFLDVLGEPCSHDKSQALFKALVARGWQISSVEDFEAGAYISSINPPHDTRTQLKYEHHPYLVEVAFDFTDNLFDLESQVSRTLCEIEEEASNVGVTVSSTPFCSVGPDHPSTRSESALAQSLRAYRRALLEKQGRTVSPELDNFSAVIAATQVHIGGLEWWISPTLIPALYSLEATLLGCSYLCCNLSGPPEYAAAKRWAGYAETLRGCPLVGFPDLNEWTRASWIAALTCTPTINGAAFDSARDFFVSVRDLQIVRPRIFGTLEFRGDPAQGSVPGILAMAAIRLACCIGARNGYCVPGSFREHRDAWWGYVSGRSANLPNTEAAELIGRAIGWLRVRGKGEEQFLKPLVAAVRRLRGH
jgi:hypothetical protein